MRDTADGVLMATGSGDGTIRVWHLHSGEPWDDIDCTDSGAVTHVAWSTCGSRTLLLSAHFDLQQEISRVLVRHMHTRTSYLWRWHPCL